MSSTEDPFQVMTISYDHKWNHFSSGNSGNCQLAIRSCIFVITLTLICLNIADFGILFSLGDEKSEKEEVLLESMLTEPYIQSLTSISDNLEVGLTYLVAW